MWFDVKNERTGHASGHSGTYPINQQQCLTIKDLGDVQEGDTITTEVQAIAGAFKETNKKVLFKDNGLKVTFQCKGGTFDYHCDILTSGRPDEEEVVV